MHQRSDNQTRFSMKRLLLLGGGHAHLTVLKHLAQHPAHGLEVFMITPHTYQHYSGMLPGQIAGNYTADQSAIDLRPLLTKAKVQLIKERVIEMDTERRSVTLSNLQQVSYDLLSIDIGCETDVSWLEMLGNQLLPVKPLDHFVKQWSRLLDVAKEKENFSLIVIGGGAAGVELAFAARAIFDQKKINAQVQLVASDAGLLKDHARTVQKRVKELLLTSKITLHQARAVGTESGIMLADGTQLSADYVIAATGSRAPQWLRTTKLTLNPQGYIAVNSFHQSCSHPEIFAAGDVCVRTDLNMARSGVHAVHAGPVLAYNLLAYVKGMPLRRYQARAHSLYLISCGTRYAVASWGRWGAQGHWVWRWKDRIDRRFIQKFSSTEW